MEQAAAVLDAGYVKIVEAWGSDERIIEAARMSTGKGFQGWGPQHDKDCLRPDLKLGIECTCDGVPGDEKLLAYLYNNKHMTPFEMAGMVIEVKAPIFVFREWHRHRTQSYNEMSARYTPLPDENYIPSIKRLMMTGGSNKQAQSVGAILDETGAKAFQAVLKEAYRDAQEAYEFGLSAGVPKELARLPVPVARYSRMRASANLRNWLQFLTLRMDPAAQWEIRQYAEAVGELIAGSFPRTWELFIGEKKHG
ncbi:MAG: FAD-dependent thymidylate synthase [Candidatus Binatia bacterium]|nr:FAD-dependent thymidylate synthase [Candidatus Binatia bacterium]